MCVVSLTEHVHFGLSKHCRAPTLLFAKLPLLNFPRITHGLCNLENGPAAQCQMAVWIDKAALLPSPCYITQTLSPLPTKIHLCSHSNL